MLSKKKVLAIQGSFKENGITTTMLKYAVKEAEKAGESMVFMLQCNRSVPLFSAPICVFCFNLDKAVGS